MFIGFSIKNQPFEEPPWAPHRPRGAAPAGCAGLQVPGAKAHGEVRDEGVLRFPRAVRHEDAPPGGKPMENPKTHGKPTCLATLGDLVVGKNPMKTYVKLQWIGCVVEKLMKRFTGAGL